MNKTSKLGIRISKEDKTIIEQAALIKGQTLSSYIVSTAIKQALNDIKENEIIHLSKDARDYLMEILDNSPEPNEALIELMSGI